MAKYELKYWFEHGGICLWAANQAAIDKFDYAIETKFLPLSSTLVKELDSL